MNICDTLILITQMTFSNTTEILYGIAIVFVISSMINKVLTSGISQVQMLIVSPKYEEIKYQLLHHLDSGVTMVHIETGMNEESQKAVLAVFSNRKVNKVKQAVLKIDKHAFMTITHITEVNGRGFLLIDIWIKRQGLFIFMISCRIMLKEGEKHGYCCDWIRFCGY